MNTMQLGDYRGGRDSITNLMGAQIPQLQNINQAAIAFGSIGLQGMAQRHAIEDKYNLELRNQMMGNQAQLSDRLMVAKQAAEQAAVDEQSMLEGETGALTDWYGLVMSKYDPNSQEYATAKQALDMITKASKGKNLKSKQAYMKWVKEYGIDKPINVGTLGGLGFRQNEPVAEKPTAAADKKPTPVPVNPNSFWATRSRFNSKGP
jgi:hypothetical protein